MSEKKRGGQTFALAAPPAATGWAAVVGHKEGQGPLGKGFYQVSQDDTFGEKSWEKAESAMQRLALAGATLKK